MFRGGRQGEVSSGVLRLTCRGAPFDLKIPAGENQLGFPSQKPSPYVEV